MNFVSSIKIICLCFSLLVFSACEDTPSIEILAPASPLSEDSDTVEITVDSERTDSITIAGRITPPNATLSVVYGGECGKSYYRDIETLNGTFSHRVPISFIREIDFFLYTPKGSESSKTLFFINQGDTRKSGEEECDYLKVRKAEDTRPSAYIVEESCYEIGYKYGSCVSRAHLDMACKPGTDVSIPFRCRERAETEAGIKAGRI
ncbi:hypothetical protein [Sulfuricurvum sp.]|uniref:hypothetical protein n=1 Tax=Sulfuricurvum sp. TaxID=2025608 RepID=UPI003C56721D